MKSDHDKISNKTDEELLQNLLDDEIALQLLEAEWQQDQPGENEQLRLQKNWKKIEQELAEDEKPRGSLAKPQIFWGIAITLAAVFLVMIINPKFMDSDQTSQPTFKGGDQVDVQSIIELDLQSDPQTEEVFVNISLRDSSSELPAQHVALIHGDQTDAEVLWQGLLAELPQTIVTAPAYGRNMKTCVVIATDAEELHEISLLALNHWEIYDGELCIGGHKLR